MSDSLKKHAPASAAGAGTVVAVILVLSSMGVISFGDPGNPSVAATERAAIAKDLDVVTAKVEALSGKIDTLNLALTSHIAGVTPLLTQYNADIAEVRGDIRKILGKL